MEENSTKVIEISSDKEFDEFIEKYQDSTITIMFYEDWCPYCKQFYPIYQKIGEEFTNEKRYFLHINISRATKTAKKFHAAGTPYLVWLKKGDVVLQRMGLQSLKEMRDYEKKI